LNGAAGIAVMTFIGAKAPGGGSAATFMWPLVLFSFGAALAVLTLLLAYFSQSFSARMNVLRRQRSTTAEGFAIAGIATIVGSAAVFVVGLWLAATKF
jgi:NO-binding membrane sensor protein with MHYT domain